MDSQVDDKFESQVTAHLKPFSSSDQVARTPKEWQQLYDELESVDLEPRGIRIHNILRNPSVPKLYEMALRHESGTAVTSTGALVCTSGKHTGRSPQDKRIVKEPSSENEVWWGPINFPLSDHSFMINRERAIDYLNTRERLFVVDGYVGWVPAHQLKVRVICARAYHALFISNMMIRPTDEQLLDFGEPDIVIYNAGQFPANRYTEGVSSSTSVCLSLARREMVILGTEYAGEMKKGIFTFMHFFMPKQGILSLHSSANVGSQGDVSLFFGLSGTGKTTLSADPKRGLVGDDMHCWYDKGVFNMEGGCYAKAIDLDPKQEPDIFNAIRFGAVLENVVYDEHTRVVDYHNISITENTRTAYPIEFIPNAVIPCVASHPKNVILLTCDAFGVLPPVAKLTPEQAAYHFITGYTAKIAGTEVGITEPVCTFSPAFSAPFLVFHPNVYADMLIEKVKTHKVHCWLVNTGWSGGG
jgi:ATP-dependent phosphoenolpyruvate carboxykinase